MGINRQSAPWSAETHARMRPGPSLRSLYLVMEDVLEKLKVLNYETKFLGPRRDFKALHRNSFAVQTVASEQFPYFAALSGWLLTVSGIDFVKWNDFDEDPNSISQTVLSECERLGFRPTFPVSKLRHGSGEEVCEVLDFLCDAALKQVGFSVKAPVYTTTDLFEEAKADDDAELGDADVEEQLPDEADLDAGGVADSKGDVEEKAVQGVVESNVDPAQWALELERVGPMLRWKNKGMSSNEWRTHIDQSAKHEKLVASRFKEVKGIMESVGKKLQQTVERISQKEDQINRDFTSIGGDYREKQANLDRVQEQYNELSQSVAELTVELANKVEEAEDMERSTKERSDKLTDTTSLERIRTSIVKMRKEIRDMELRIGVVSQILLHRTANPPA